MLWDSWQELDSVLKAETDKKQKSPISHPTVNNGTNVLNVIRETEDVIVIDGMENREKDYNNKTDENDNGTTDDKEYHDKKYEDREDDKEGDKEEDKDNKEDNDDDDDDDIDMDDIDMDDQEMDDQEMDDQEDVESQAEQVMRDKLRQAGLLSDWAELTCRTPWEHLRQLSDHEHQIVTHLQDQLLRNDKTHLEFATSLLRLGNLPLTRKTVETKLDSLRLHIHQLRRLLLLHREEKQAEVDQHVAQLDNLSRLAYDASIYCIMELSVRESRRGLNRVIGLEPLSTFWCKFRNYNKVDPTTRIYIQCLLYFKFWKLRRRGDNVYEEITTSDGIGTHAWTVRCTLDTIVDQVCCKDQRYDLWEKLHTAETRAKVIHKLKTNTEREMVLLKPIRYWTAWKGHLYNARDDKAYAYDSKEFEELSDDIVACRYSPVDFYADPIDPGKCILEQLHTPAVDILAFQGFDARCIRWIFGLGMGRCIYAPRMFDRYDVFMYILGAAGLGKSTLIKKTAAIFDPQDVGVTGDLMEEVFGLSSLYDKLLFIATDLTRSCKIDSATICSMTTFGLVSIARKNKKNADRIWQVMFALAGNELPDGWTNTYGNLARRILLVQCQNVPRKRDRSYETLIEQQFGKFYRCINLCYKMVLEEIGSGRDYWTKMPETLAQAQRTVQHHNNPLASFLDNEEFCHINPERPDLYCKESDLQTAYQMYCKPRGYRPTLDIEVLKAVLAEKGCRHVWEEKKWPVHSNRRETSYFFEGISIQMPGRIQNHHLSSSSSSGFPSSTSSSTSSTSSFVQHQQYSRKRKR